MSAVQVDSIVLLGVVTDNPEWGERSAAAPSASGGRSPLAINPLLCAWISVGFDRIEELKQAIPRELYSRVALPCEAASLAGKRFLRYRLLSRGARRYREHFPTLELSSPQVPAVRVLTHHGLPLASELDVAARLACDRPEGELASR